MNDELNTLTQRLYAQGYTRDNHPDTVYWGDWQNFCYKWETMLQFTWETPCGLLIQGESNVGRDVAASECFYQHIWYCPENDNPLFRCPYQQKSCEHVPLGFPLVMCPCHRTDRAYDYACSMEKVMAEHNREAFKQYMELTGGSYCACVVGNNGYEGGYYEVKYDVMNCIRCGCKNPVCVIRKQPRDLKKANIFYDVRRTWITRQGFLEEKKVEVTKGLKVFDHAVAQTDAEIWLKMKEHGASPLNNYAVIEQPKKTSEDRRQEYFSKMHRRYDDQYDYFEFHYEVENIRIARSEQRDLLQDLRDAAEGIEVIHAADSLKAAKVQKRTRRETAKARKIQKVEKMVLAYGWDALEDTWKRRAEKLLGEDRIDELLQQRQAPKATPPKGIQLSLFSDESDRPLDTAC